MDMNLIGWYDTNDNSGGQIIELRFDGNDEFGNPIYFDDRKVQKYYQKTDGEFLRAFTPEY